jgi:hypothetical protein
MNDSQYGELRHLKARTAWLRPWMQRGSSWALQGPQWLPGWVRRLPLEVCVLMVRLELWRLRHGV